MITCKIIIFAALIIVGIIFSFVFFLSWVTKNIKQDDKGTPNSVLGYNIAFDIMAWSVTALVIVISFVTYLTTDFKDLAVLIMGISIGSVLTRTPSFKQKDK